MSVTEHTPISTATGDGVSLAAGFAFPVLDEADLKVKVAGVLLTLNVDYTVAGVGNPAGGTVTFTVAPANGAAISLYRESVLQRETDYQTAGDFRAETVNPDFDRLWLVLMETLFGARSSSASMRAPLGEILAEMPARASRASKVAAFDSNGDPIAVAPGGDASGLETRLQSLLDPADGAGLVGFQPELNYVAGTLGYAMRSTLIPVNVFDDVDPTGATDTGTALNAAIAFINAMGALALLRGVYTTTVQITNAGDFGMVGEPGSVMRDGGNDPAARVIAGNRGAVINWTGGNTTSVVSINPDVASRVTIRDIAFLVGNGYQTSIVKLKGVRWFGYTGVTAHYNVTDCAFYRDSQATNPAASACSGIELDLTDSAMPRCFFGHNFSGHFCYGLEQGLYLNTVNQVTAASGNWANGNHFDRWHLYKCYRAMHIIAGTTGYDQVSMNYFANWQVQPVGDGGGVFAPGVFRLVNNANRNTFIGMQVYDLVSAGGARRHIHANPHSTNPTAFNRYINCIDFEFDSSSPMSIQVDPDECSGSATYDPANLIDGAGATTTVTAAGAVLGDFASASFSLDLQGITLTAWVSAADTVSVRFQNETGGPIDLGSGTLRVKVEKL